MKKKLTAFVLASCFALNLAQAVRASDQIDPKIDEEGENVGIAAGLVVTGAPGYVTYRAFRGDSADTARRDAWRAEAASTSEEAKKTDAEHSLSLRRQIASQTANVKAAQEQLAVLKRLEPHDVSITQSAISTETATPFRETKTVEEVTTEHMSVSQKIRAQINSLEKLEYELIELNKEKNKVEERVAAKVAYVTKGVKGLLTDAQIKHLEPFRTQYLERIAEAERFNDKATLKAFGGVAGFFASVATFFTTAHYAAYGYDDFETTKAQNAVKAQTPVGIGHADPIIIGSKVGNGG